MRGSLVNRTADFVVHEHAASVPQSSSSCSASAATAKEAAAACRPAHASPSFVLPSASAGRLPLLYRPDARFARRTSASIGYACNAQQSGNMQLSLQWETAGELRRWEKERPYAVRDERERQQRRQARRETEEEKQQIDLFAAFPACVHPVPAAAAFDLHENNPLLPPAQTAGSSVELDSCIGSTAARRLQARRLLAAGALYDPYASSTLPFFAPSASHYTAVYTAPPSPSRCSRSSLKVSLSRHPAAAYSAVREAAAAGSGGYRGRNNRWTESRLFFRGFSSSGEAAATASGASSSAGVELLFSRPLYSSFSLDALFHEPQRTRKQRPQRWSRLQPPMMRRRQATQQQHSDGGQGAEQGEEEEKQRRQRAAEERRQQAAADAAVQKAAAVRLSGVFVPRVDSRRFMSSLSSRQTV